MAGGKRPWPVVPAQGGMPGMMPPQTMPMMPGSPIPPGSYPLSPPQPFVFNPARLPHRRPADAAATSGDDAAKRNGQAAI